MWYESHLMAVLLLPIKPSLNVRVSDLVIHSTTYESCISAVEPICVFCPQLFCDVLENYICVCFHCALNWTNKPVMPL